MADRYLDQETLDNINASADLRDYQEEQARRKYVPEFSPNNSKSIAGQHREEFGRIADQFAKFLQRRSAPVVPVNANGFPLVAPQRPTETVPHYPMPTNVSVPRG